MELTYTNLQDNVGIQTFYHYWIMSSTDFFRFNGIGASLKSMTFDRGTEFANHYELPADTYFCDPGSPWQKGAVENMNGRIRTLLPKHVRPQLLKQKDLDIIADILNNTPRQALGFKTPKELFYAHLSEAPS